MKFDICEIITLLENIKFLINQQTIIQPVAYKVINCLKKLALYNNDIPARQTFCQFFQRMSESMNPDNYRDVSKFLDAKAERLKLHTCPTRSQEDSI